MNKEIKGILAFCIYYGIIQFFEQQKHLTDSCSVFGYSDISSIILESFVVNFWPSMWNTQYRMSKHIYFVYILTHLNLEHTTSCLKAKEIRLV